MASPIRLLQQRNAPLDKNMGVGSATVPLTGSGIQNTTIGVAAVKVLSASTNPSGRMRHCRLRAKGGDVAYTTVIRDTSAPGITATGALTDGIFVGAGETDVFSVPDNADLYLVGAAVGTAYQLSVSEV
jgi:hypothetical protein